MNPEILFDATQIGERIDAIAEAIARAQPLPEVAAPVLAGSFVFAADLLRALARRGAMLRVEFLWLRSYGERRMADREITVLAGPSEGVRGRHVLLLDGVLDHGRTLARARELVAAAGAKSIKTAVAIDKAREQGLMKADFAAFRGIDRFVVGYGMDLAGEGRTLPYIGAAD